MAKRNFMNYLCEQPEDQGKKGKGKEEEEEAEEDAYNISAGMTFTSSLCKRHKSILFEAAEKQGQAPTASSKEETEEKNENEKKEKKEKKREKKGEKETDETPTVHKKTHVRAWMNYARVLEHIAEKEIVRRAFGIFHKSMKDDHVFMQHARASFREKDKSASARVKAQLFAHHVKTTAHELFEKKDDDIAASSSHVIETKDKSFESAMRMFALESEMVRL